MSWFLGGIALLVLGYFTYGRLVERLLPPDDRKTPSSRGFSPGRTGTRKASTTSGTTSRG